MGYIEAYNLDKDGHWQDINDIPRWTQIDCQSCGKASLCSDIVIVVQNASTNPTAKWQCKNCWAFNG